MTNSVIVTPFFERKFKRLAKKFPSLYEEIRQLEDILLRNPKTGIDLGSNVFKIRLASKSKKTGKSGGFRIITYSIEQNKDGYEINLITIYDKSEETTITKEEISKLIRDIFD